MYSEVTPYIPRAIEQKILLLEHVNYFTTMQIQIMIMTVI